MSALPFINVGKGTVKAVSSRTYVLQHRQIAGTSCQTNGTATLWKHSSGTTGKLVGVVTIHWVGTIGSQVLRAYAYGCSSQTKCRWVRCIHLA